MGWTALALIVWVLSWAPIDAHYVKPISSMACGMTDSTPAPVRFVYEPVEKFYRSPNGAFLRPYRNWWRDVLH